MFDSLTLRVAKNVECDIMAGVFEALAACNECLSCRVGSYRPACLTTTLERIT